MITKLKSSLTVKIFLITCLLLTSVCVLTYGLIAQLMPRTYLADREALLTTQGGQLVEQLKGSTLVDCEPLLFQFSFQSNAQASIMDSAGNTVAGITFANVATPGEQGQWKTITTQPGANVSFPIEQEKDDYIVQCVAYEFTFRDSPELYQLFVLSNTRAVNQAMEALGRIWPWLAAAILLVSIFTSVFYARFITRPIVRLSGISQKISELDFSWRCGGKRTDEIGTLERSLDTLADRLSQALEELQSANAALQQDIEKEQRLEQAQLEFFSAVSHELKTPITVIKGQLGGMLDGVGVYADRDKYLAHSLAVVQQMEGLVQELLTVSRMDTGGGLSLAPVELTALVQECLQNCKELFCQKEQTLAADLPPEAWVKGESSLLKKVLGNLLSNAALYSPEGALIHVAIQKSEGKVLFRVENEGVHIAPDSLPHLFEAFYRGDPSRNRQTGGSGLGLYLVQRIAQRHGGSCQICNSEKGVLATLELPNSTENTQ